MYELSQYLNIIDGAKLRNYPVPTLPYGYRFKCKKNFSSKAKDEYRNDNVETVATVISVVCFQNGYTYKVSFDNIMGELAKIGWSASLISAAKSQGAFECWYTGKILSKGDRSEP